MDAPTSIGAALAGTPGLRWAITGVAGFIGSNLLETLLRLDQHVVGLDNFATGHRRNLAQVRALAGEQRWSRFKFIEGDIRTPDDCRTVCDGADVVLHQAALGSVPRSIDDPLASHQTNVTGFLNMLVAARDAKVPRFVYAASSAVYGDHPGLPKVEDRVGQVLSPYAATKAFNEVYAGVFARQWAMQCVGLRYFNVFGARQDPDGPYAAVIPRWISRMLRGDEVLKHGDGLTSRDFCYVDNAVQANLRAAIAAPEFARGEIYNIAFGQQTTLVQLHTLMADLLRRTRPGREPRAPRFTAERAGDVRHSLADIGKASRSLGYSPSFDVRSGLERTWQWSLEQHAQSRTLERVE